MDDEFFAELMQTFLLEFDELMQLYLTSLKTLRKSGDLTEEKKQAYADVFRIYHTLKGDSGYFPEFEQFTAFTKEFCEVLRPLDDSVYHNDEVLTQISLNYSRLSSALAGMQKGRRLQAFNL